MERFGRMYGLAAAQCRCATRYSLGWWQPLGWNPSERIWLGIMEWKEGNSHTS